MRFCEIAHRPRQKARQRWLSTVTLYVFEEEWEKLQTILKQHGPTEIIAVRPLCRFSGLSVDVLCTSPEAASELLGKWHDNSIERLDHTVAKQEAQR